MKDKREKERKKIIKNENYYKCLILNSLQAADLNRSFAIELKYFKVSL